MRGALRGSIDPGRHEHPQIHLVAGCVVKGIDLYGRESIERAEVGESPMFWGHCVAADGRQLWLADFDDRKLAMEAAKAHAGRRPVFLEDNGILMLVSGEALPTRPT